MVWKQGRETDSVWVVGREGRMKVGNGQYRPDLACLGKSGLDGRVDGKVGMWH